MKSKYKAWVCEKHGDIGSQLTNSDIETFAIDFAEWLVKNSFIPDSSSNHFDEDHNNWCKVFDDMLESPYIDVSSIRECDIIAISSWLSTNYKSPVKRDKPNYR